MSKHAVYSYQLWQRYLVVASAAVVVLIVTYGFFWGSGSENMPLWLDILMIFICYLLVIVAWDRFGFTQAVEILEEGIVAPVFRSRGFFFSSFDRRLTPWEKIIKVEDVKEGFRTGVIPLKEFESAYGIVLDDGEIFIFPQIENYDELKTLVNSKLASG